MITIETVSIKYPRLKRRTGIKFLMLGLFALAFGVIIVFKSDVEGLNILVFIAAFVGFAYSYISKQRENPVPYFDQPLIISENSIQIGDTEYQLDHIKDLKFEVNEFDGEERIVSRSSKYILNGTNNKVSFAYYKEKITANFYLISEVQKDELTEIFRSWYNKRIPFYESDSSGKTYLLQKLNYIEIQEFKKKHNW